VTNFMETPAKIGKMMEVIYIYIKYIIKYSNYSYYMLLLYYYCCYIVLYIYIEVYIYGCHSIYSTIFYGSDLEI
jgi:hypothetical protein